MTIDERSTKSVVLILGATGLTGSFLIEAFDRNPRDVHIRVAARRPDQVKKFQSEGRDAALLDLDNPQTLGRHSRGGPSIPAHGIYRGNFRDGKSYAI